MGYLNLIFKKTTLSFIAACSAVVPAFAGQLDQLSRATLLRNKVEHSGVLALPGGAGPLRSNGALGKLHGHAVAPATGKDVPATPASRMLAFATLAPGACAADLEAEGMEVLTLRGDIAIVSVAADDVEKSAASPFVRSMQLERTLHTHTDLGRTSIGVDRLHAGDAASGLQKAYTGKGVCAAIVDQGVDAHHINFCNEDGSSRIAMLTNVYGGYYQEPTVVIYGNPDEINGAKPLSDFKTDEPNAYHGTHTLGILAGGYKGDVTVSEGLDNIQNPVRKTIPNPYYGVATGAEIAVSCGTLSDICVAYGMDYLMGYMNGYKGLPIVYNLSLGSNTGPHDTRSTISKFFDLMAADGAIICLSAGNEGDTKLALNRTFTDDNKSFKTFIDPTYYRYNAEGTEERDQTTLRYGSIVLYGDDETPFDVQVVIYNKSRNYRAAVRIPISAGGASGVYYATDASIASQVSGQVLEGTFADNFRGYVGGGITTDEDTGRSYAMVDMYLYDNGANLASGQYVVGIEVTGESGKRIDMYTDGQFIEFSDYGVDGFADGSTNGSISDMAVSPNIIAVGSYNTRQQWYTLDGYAPSYPGDGFTPGHVSGFSSYGTLADGRNLPLVCAPGAAIISSMSGEYLRNFTSQYDVTEAEKQEYYNYLNSARATVDGKDYYWKQEVGTSMASPMLAGSIALWLEADPTLTVHDVQDIIRNTAVVDDIVSSEDPVRWGAGKFDALAGLKEVVRRSSITTVSADSGNDRLVLTTVAPNCYNIFVGGANGLDAKVYTASGATAATFAAAGDELTADLSVLAPGVYILTANGHSAKIVVK